MSTKIQLAKAISTASSVFEDKFDKGGQPYILHCLYVMFQMPAEDNELRTIAVLHDVVEDTHLSINYLRTEGYSERVLTALSLLTHDHSVSYDDYIKAIALNEDARRVKLADLKHNSDIMRMKGLRKKDFDRLEKYHRSYAYLSS